jgi:uncharacterized protein YndB with AHSA1/START domain
MMTRTDLSPVVKTIDVRCPVERAFERFTGGIATWWPAETHSVGGGRVEEVVLQGRTGGRIFERWSDGHESEWGRVQVWQPPHRLVFSWEPSGERDGETEVEVRFTPTESGTRVVLEHRHWERLGAAAADLRRDYEPGWDYVLGRYTAIVA